MNMRTIMEKLGEKSKKNSRRNYIYRSSLGRGKKWGEA